MNYLANNKKMRLHRIFIIGILAFLYACTRPEPSVIEFDGNRFKLPTKVGEAKKALGLQYGYYSGFFKGNVNDKSMQTQLEGYPSFMGSDNDSEESYYDQYFVGISFFKTNAKLYQIKSEFQRRYGKEFKTKTKDFGPTRTLPPFNMTYHYFRTDEGLFVALKENERKSDLKKYISISFYKGISESELADYLEYVY